MIDAVAIALRGLGYLALLQAAGLFVFLVAFRDSLAEALPVVRRAARVAVLVAFVAVIAANLVQPARLAGAWSGLASGSLHALWLGSAAGDAAVARLVGLVLLWAGLSNPSRTAAVTGAVGTLCVVGSFALVGHTVAHDARLGLAGLLVVHVGIVAFWLGALPGLYIATVHDPARVAGRLVARFSRAASALVPLILLAGLWMALYLLPGLAALQTPYGYALAAKVGGFTALIGLAALNKWRFGPRIAGATPGAAMAFRRGVCVEWLLVAGVLGVTATLTTLFSPE